MHLHMVDLIHKKKNGQILTAAEIAYFIKGYTNGEIPDYQVSALLMAICLRGMTAEETAAMTLEMAGSGDIADLSEIEGLKVDKHSTGGVGDKTTLVIVPIAAACGVKIAKMSGRGLGHTGGTIDKLESIPGVRTEMDRTAFISAVQQAGAAIIGQSGNLCPADKKLYALRDVTGTVDSIPLIAASVMSKKIAAGADCILLDVKSGSGAFMKTDAESQQLAQEMVQIGTSVGRKTMAVITDMSAPLGKNIGNALEIAEVCEVLQGKGPEDLRELCLLLAAQMIYLGEKAASQADALTLAETAVSDGSAFRKLKEIIAMQGGDPSYLDDTAKLPQATCTRPLYAGKSGYVKVLDAQLCGQACVLLGAGRETKDSRIDYGAGITLHKKPGDSVRPNDLLLMMHADNPARFDDAESLLRQAFSFSETKPAHSQLIKKIIE